MKPSGSSARLVIALSVAPTLAGPNRAGSSGVRSGFRARVTGTQLSNGNASVP
jgi:hypothetical protein